MTTKLHLAFFSLLLAPLPAQTITSELVASGLTGALVATSPRNDFDRIFVAQQNGTIRLVKNGALLATPFHTQTVLSGGERGLLGLAFHPNYASNGFFYVSYTRQTDGASMVVRYRASAGNPDVSDPASAATMIGPVTQPFSNHNGGCIQFGPDGRLYFALGDGGSGGDPSCNAQNGLSLLGKMLRLDVDTNPNGPAIAAAGNPFIGNPAFDAKIWDFGLRNPWRFSFDRLTGDLWIGDVGQNALEEIDFAPAGTGGRNWGWKIKEGTNCYSTSACTSPPSCMGGTLTDPVRTIPTTTYNAIIGGYAYRGCAIPALRGHYFHGNNALGPIWSFRLVGGAVTSFVDRKPALNAPGSSITSFGEDAGGELLFCAGSSVWRMAAVGTLANSNAGAGSVGGNGRTPVYEACGKFGNGNSVTLRLRHAVPGATAAVLFSTTSSPVTLPIAGFGTLVPVPVLFTLNLTTDAEGIATWQVPAVPVPLTFFHQCAILDAPLGGVTMSNALQTTFTQ